METLIGILLVAGVVALFVGMVRRTILGEGKRTVTGRVFALETW